MALQRTHVQDTTLQSTMANGNATTSMTVTRTADDALTLSGGTGEIGDALERLGRGLGYGAEKARLKYLQGAGTGTEPKRPGQKVWRTTCESCRKSILGDKVHYWREWKFLIASYYPSGL